MGVGHDSTLERDTPRSWFEAYLLQTDPVSDPVSREVTDLVAEAEWNVDIVWAEQLADHAVMSLRNLQRLFTEFIGIGPKVGNPKFRILDAAAPLTRPARKLVRLGSRTWLQRPGPPHARVCGCSGYAACDLRTGSGHVLVDELSVGIAHPGRSSQATGALAPRSYAAGQEAGSR
jgi:hypothetical protein